MKEVDLELEKLRRLKSDLNFRWVDLEILQRAYQEADDAYFEARINYGMKHKLNWEQINRLIEDGDR